MEGQTNTQNNPPEVTIQDPEFLPGADELVGLESVHDVPDLFPELDREDKYILGGIGAAAVVGVVSYRGGKERFGHYAHQAKEFAKEAGRGFKRDMKRAGIAILRGGFKLYDKAYAKSVELSAKFHTGGETTDENTEALATVDAAFMHTLGAAAIGPTGEGGSRFEVNGRSFGEVKDRVLQPRRGDDRYLKRVLEEKSAHIEALVGNAKSRRASGRDSAKDLEKSMKDLHMYIDTIKPGDIGRAKRGDAVRSRLHRWGVKLGIYEDPAAILHQRISDFREDIARVQALYLDDIDRAKQARAEGNSVLYNQILEDVSEKLQTNLQAGAIKQEVVPVIMAAFDERLASPLVPGNDTVAARSLRDIKKLEADESERLNKLRRELTDPSNIIGLKQAIDFEIKRAISTGSLSKADIDTFRLNTTSSYLEEYMKTEDGSDLPEEIKLQITRLLHLPLPKLTAMLKARPGRTPRRKAA